MNHGFITPIRVLEGSVITVTCNQGFVVAGNWELTCINATNNTFSSPFPTCVKLDPGLGCVIQYVLYVKLGPGMDRVTQYVLLKKLLVRFYSTRSNPMIYLLIITQTSQISVRLKNLGATSEQFVRKQAGLH